VRPVPLGTGDNFQGLQRSLEWGAPGKLRAIASALYRSEEKPPPGNAFAEALAKSDKHAVLGVWPENVRSFNFFSRIGSRWVAGMNGVTGIRWEALYPLMDRMGLDSEAWDDLLSDLEVMESAALSAINKKDG
jgi:hypothetical protein